VRINISGPEGFEGWFDDAKADSYATPTETLWHAANGRWALQRAGSYQFIEDAAARQWLIDHELQAEAAQLDVPPKGGRPEIGGAVRVRLGGLLPAVDALAARRHLSRAEAIRHLVHRGLQAEGNQQ